MAYLLMLVAHSLTAMNTVCRKGWLQRTGHIRYGMDIYVLLAHPIAALYFFLIAGGNVPLNGSSAGYALVYAAVCLLSVFVSMTAMNRVNLVYISVFGGAGGVVIPFLFDVLIQGQPFILTRFLAVVVRLCAIAVPLLAERKGRQNMLICLLLFLISGAAAIIPKLYSANPNAVSDASYCFWTNVFILPIAAGQVLLKARGKLPAMLADVKKMDVISILCIFGATACSNIGSLITLQIMRLVDVSVYAVVSGSLGMLVTVLLSTLVYKEKFTVRTAVSVACSILAVILGVL